MTDFGTITITTKQSQFSLPYNWPKRDDLEGRLDFLLSMIGNAGYKVFDTQLSSNERRAIQVWLVMQHMTDSIRRFIMVMPGFASAFKNASLSMKELRKAMERIAYEKSKICPTG